MSEYVCALHGRVLKIVKNGVITELLDGNGDSYKVYVADSWACPKCGFEILVTAPLPVAEHWQQGFEFYRDRITVTFQH